MIGIPVSREAKRAYDKQYSKRRRAEHMDVVRLIRRRGACLDCGESDEIVLQYHHRDRAEKKFNIPNFGGHSLKTLLAEIAKCDLLCANCHVRREHWLASHGLA